MKIIKTLTFAALAALAVALLFQTSITRADDNGQSDEHGQQAKVTFTKHGVSTVPVPGLILNMVGVGEGDAGDVLFTIGNRAVPKADTLSFNSGGGGAGALDSSRSQPRSRGAASRVASNQAASDGVNTP